MTTLFAVAHSTSTVESCRERDIALLPTVFRQDVARAHLPLRAVGLFPPMHSVMAAPEAHMHTVSPKG